jgi:hypothetical protein
VGDCLLKINSFNENYAPATKNFQNRTHTKKKEKIFSFLSFFFRFFLNEIYRPKNEIYCKTAQKISEKRGNFRFLNSSPVKQKKFPLARCITIS